MVAGGVIGFWGRAVVVRGDVAAWKDVGGGEGGGLFYTLEEQDLILRGYEEDAGRFVSVFCLSVTYILLTNETMLASLAR